MNKYLHTVASVGFLFTLNYDARNHELKKCVLIFSKTFVSNISHFKKYSVRYYHMRIDLLVKYLLFLPDF